jgi:dephospho-CoA kinase
MAYPIPAQDHFLIGLTGNIGTGKSLVRALLERQGALGIDADWLSRLASMPGAPAFAAILGRFGAEILGAGGEIDRRKLADTVFTDDQGLKDLEAILHPEISRASAALSARSPLPVVVIEAIKLLESDLAAQCGSIWVVDADEQTVFQRLQSLRGMSRAEAQRRLARQSPPEEKIRRADVVIRNSGDIKETSAQVAAAWNGLKRLPTLPVEYIDIREKLNLMQPSAENTARLGDFLRSHPGSLPALYLQEILGRPARGGGWYENEALLFQCLARYYVSLKNENDWTVWDIRHADCNIAMHFSDAASSRDRLAQSLADIEAFGKFHLCERFVLQANQSATGPLRDLGYAPLEVRDNSSALRPKAGYNLFTKTCPEVLPLFQGLNGR